MCYQFLCIFFLTKIVFNKHQVENIPSSPMCLRWINLYNMAGLSKFIWSLCIIVVQSRLCLHEIQLGQLQQCFCFKYMYFIVIRNLIIITFHLVWWEEVCISCSTCSSCGFYLFFIKFIFIVANYQQQNHNSIVKPITFYFYIYELLICLPYLYDRLRKSVPLKMTYLHCFFVLFCVFKRSTSTHHSGIVLSLNSFTVEYFS